MHPPFAPPDTAGSALGFHQTLANAVAGIKNVDTVVIGHMAVVDWSDLRESAEFHKRFLATVQAAAKAGQSVDDFVEEYKWPGIVAAPTQEAQFASWRTNYVQAIYDALRK